MADPASTIGQTIAHYRVLEKLGAGGMGVVYKALDLKLQRPVALKFLPAEAALDERDKQVLLQEARAACALDHPHIGAIYGLEETADHTPFIVMAYYEGETLAQIIARGPAPANSFDLLLQIARGLAAAHARNVVHRDIKPSNIIVTGEGIAKLVDFGLARVLTSSAMTQSLHTSGTLPYMAPEQVLGEPATPACDTWAFGILLVELFTGRRPFDRDNAAAATFAILNQPPMGLDALPPALCAIAYHALAKKAEQRYPSGKEFLAELESLSREAGVSAAAVGSNTATRTHVVTARELKKYAENASVPRWSPAISKTAPRRWLYVALTIFALAVASLPFPQVRQRLASMLSTSVENHIAVLPFDNVGGEPAMEAEAQGLMDAMTDELSNLSSVQKSLWVIPASVVRSRKILDASAAARELGATLVVRGTIQRSGQSVRLSVNLTDAKNLRQIGATSLEDSAGDIAALQNEAVSRLAQMMNIKASADMLRVTGGSVAPAAYESYLKALGFMQRYDKPGNLDEAIAALGTSVETDSRFALGYAQLGEAYRLKYKLDRNPKWLEEAQANCQKAAEIDNRLPAAYVTLGRIHELNGKNDLALEEFQQALKVNPRSAEALGGLASAYENSGHQQEAEAAFIKAAALRPDYWDGYDELGLYYDRQAKYPQSIEQLRHAAELTPDNAQVYSNLGAVYVDSGDPKVLPDAEKALKKSIELGPTYAAYANLASLYYHEKRFNESAPMWEQALKINDHDYLVWGYLANTYKWLKQEDKADTARDKALALLEPFAKLKPQDAEAQAHLATIYAKKKLRDKAMVRIQAALALSPDDPNILENVGVAYEALGDRVQALRNIERSLQKGNSFESVKNDPDLQSLLGDPNFRANGK